MAPASRSAARDAHNAVAVRGGRSITAALNVSAGLAAGLVYYVIHCRHYCLRTSGEHAILPVSYIVTRNIACSLCDTGMSPLFTYWTV